MRFINEDYDAELQAGAFHFNASFVVLIFLVIDIRKDRGTYVPVKVLQRPSKKKRMNSVLKEIKTYFEQEKKNIQMREKTTKLI